jgi:hypothetical protein
VAVALGARGKRPAHLTTEKRPKNDLQVLGLVYGQFVEGFDPADLWAAKLLIGSFSIEMTSSHMQH